MPGVGWSKPKPYHWRVLFRWWLDPWRRFTDGDSTKDWLVWVHSYADPHGLGQDCEDFFWSHIRAGVHPSIAASWALEEWDI